MNPNIEDRLNSVLRALSDVILPALPDEASLAREQAQIVFGQLSIIRSQLDAVPQFEQCELDDISQLAQVLISEAGGGDVTQRAVSQLSNQLALSINGEHIRNKADRLRLSIDQLLRSIPKDGSKFFRSQAMLHVLEYEGKRSLVDRQWFSPMGFDVEYSG